jgi:hypothetical protein
MLKIAISALLALSMSFAGAQSAVSEEYVPPPEAFEGPGGWAVVDPTTGVVYGVIVGDWNAQTWEEVKNTRTLDGYMGCPAPCALRWQTRATADGNVAGWHGTQTNVDADGNATQSNNGSVRYDQSTGNFQINNQTENGVTSTQTLVPEKTSRNPDGTGRSMNLSSGIVDIRTSKAISQGGQSASVTTYRSNTADETLDARVSIPGLGSDGTVLEYVFGSASSNSTERSAEAYWVENDLISILFGQGFGKQVEITDQATGEVTSAEVVDEANPFVNLILDLGKSVVEFLGSLLGWMNPSR